MNPYQNFSQNPQNMNNPYSNYMQNLQNQISTMQQQMQNYQQALANMQQAHIPTQQNSGIVTQIVDSFENISANSVPMDNFGAVFVLRNGAEIQTKRWSGDGDIITTSYKPILDDFNSNMDNSANQTEKSNLGASDGVTEALMKSIDTLTERMTNIEQKLTPTRTRKSKEVEPDEQ